MEKAKVRIEKRGTAKYGYIFLAFLTVNIYTYPYFEENLIMIADRQNQLLARLLPWNRRFDLEIERNYAICP